tara:strand:+ start:291 stop:674 length:384 start_codon:yes stop_codon:yes gene_type:complete
MNTTTIKENEMTELDNVGASWEGWSTRATWCANLWISNEQQPYTEALAIGADARVIDSPTPERDTGLRLLQMLTAWMQVSGGDSAIVQDFTDNATGESMLDEINVRELGAAWIAEAKEIADWEEMNG